MKISVIIPCYNLGDYVIDAVESVKAQSLKDFEMIIVDDGSTDPQTIKILDTLHDDRIKVLKTTNKKLAGARNYGIGKASGEYIVCLDADDVLAPTFLEKTSAVLDRDKEKKVAFVTTWLLEFGERDNLWRSGDFNIPQLLVNNIVHAGSLFRKDVWEEVGGYKDEMIGGYEDWEFWLSVVEKGYRWAVIPEPLFLYRIRKNSMLQGAKQIHLDLYSRLYGFHKNMFKKYIGELILESAKEIKTLHQSIKAKNESIAELELQREEVISLRHQVFKLRDEISSMRNSRVLGRIIKFREFVGTSRQHFVHLPEFIIHKTRVEVAPFIPKQIRKFAKRLYRKIRHYKTINIVRELQENKLWPNSLPLVSIIIPYYNRADTIDDTINSLATQTYKNSEIIVVDDGSSDVDSIEKLKQLEKADLKARFINQENAGVSAARNNGIVQAKGKYIMCLDSDDAIEPTFIEKAIVVLETSPDTSLVTTHMETFGVINDPYKHVHYDPVQLIRNNMVITAAVFKKAAWEEVGGYKSGIGYEDWEFWVNLAEQGFWGKLIPEPLFMYRTSMQSRYVGDKDVHWTNLKSIRELHPQYKKKVQKLLMQRRAVKHVIDPSTAFINLGKKDSYEQKSSKKNILIVIPWMTFGGAETLILNFCHEVKDSYNLSFVTGLESEHEWEHKFKAISQDIYHLANLFEDKDLYIEFISNYINTRSIDAIHIIHTDYVFEMLPELKSRHPKLKVLVTLFNDRAAHFEKSLKVKEYVDAFSSDNETVYQHYRKKLGEGVDVRVISNGINSEDVFNPILFDRMKERFEIGLSEKDLVVFFIGRLSEEKNPDVFLKVAKKIVSENQAVKFFVIGDGTMAAEIKKMVSAINDKNVQYLGYQSDIAKYLSAADIFILPSSIEGFPLSILEAMAMRVAVIASDVGAVSEIIESGVDGLIVEPGSVTEITDAIIALTNNPKLLAKIKGNAREKVDKKYSNIILGENYKKLYRDLTE